MKLDRDRVEAGNREDVAGECGLGRERILQLNIAREQCGEIARPERSRWHGRDNSIALLLPVPFVIEEVEGLVAPDRTAKRSAELIAVEWALHSGIERAARLPCRIAVIFERASVIRIAAAARDQGDLRSRLAVLGRGRTGSNLELADHIHRDRGRRLVLEWIVVRG